MKKKLMTIIIASSLLLSAVLGLVACNLTLNDAKGETEKARDIYAMSAVSSISYLSGKDNMLTAQAKRPVLASASGVDTSPATTLVRPDSVTDADIESMKNSLSMFDGIIADGGIEQSIKENTSTDPLFANYSLEMTISMRGTDAKPLTYTMYFNEVDSKTNIEIDDGIEEIEVSTRFEGLVDFGGEIFIVKGEREVESEGLETESSIEFITYKNIGTDTVVADESNFVIVSHSVESGEVEYEYSIFEGGRKVQDFEIEYEKNMFGSEVSFELKDLGTGAKNKTEFKIKSGVKDNEFVVIFEKNGKTERINVTKLADSSYSFKYANGFEETVN